MEDEEKALAIALEQSLKEYEDSCSRLVSASTICLLLFWLGLFGLIELFDRKLV